NPKNERTSDGVLEAFQFLTASILLESIYMSFREIWRLAASMEDHKSEIENWALGAEIYIKYYTLRSSLKEDENSMNERLVSSFRQFFLFQMSRPNGMFESSLESLNSFKNISTMMSNSPQMPPCCPKCYHDYEQELAKLKDAEKSAFELDRQTLTIAMRFLRSKTPEQRAAVDLDTHYTQCLWVDASWLPVNDASLYRIIKLMYYGDRISSTRP
ncbi:hypothetical protein Tco_1247948, partial [Tanacetum coccineum]